MSPEQKEPILFATMPRTAVDDSPSKTLGLTEAQVKQKGIQKGSLFCRGGVWHIAFRKWMEDEQGNITYRPTSESTHETSKRNARIVGDRIVAKANAPSECPRGTATVTAFVETFFWPQHVIKKKKSGVEHYKTHWEKHVKPSIGEMQMNAVDPVVVQRLITTKHLKLNLSASSLTHIRNCISKIFSFARVMGYYKGDLPTSGISMPRAARSERQALTPEQVERILENLGGDENACLYRALIVLLAITGMRVGEALGLRWEDITPDLTYAHVRQAWVRQEFTTPKNGKPRIVPITGRAMEYLRMLRDLRPAEGLVFRAPSSPKGNPIDLHNLTPRIWKPACIKAGVPWATIHCLRHTAATDHDNAGITVAERRQVFGHSSDAMALHYTHASAALVRAKLEKVQ